MSTAARIEELRKKFTENPRRYFAPLANELRKAGDLQSAIALCREHLPKQPGHMSGYIVFGQALYDTGSLDEARQVFEQALSLDPENLIALRHLGDIARRQGDVATARRWYERVLDTDPRNDDIAAQLARLNTPIQSVPAVSATPTPGVPMPVVPAPLRDLQPVSFTPSVPIPAVGAVIPTPDAVLRAVDFDRVNADLRSAGLAGHTPSPVEPTPAVEHADEVGAVVDSPAEPDVGPSVDSLTPVLPVVADEGVAIDDLLDIEGMELTGARILEEDDPFAFGSDSDVAAAESADAFDGAVDAQAQDEEAEFVEGLAAPEWPDTAELEARLLTPRTATSVTPVSVPITPEAAVAFGHEATDRVETPLPPVEPDVLPVEPELAMSADVVIPAVVTAEVEAEVAAEVDDGASLEAEASSDTEDDVEVSLDTEVVADVVAEVSSDAEVEAEAALDATVPFDEEVPAEAGDESLFVTAPESVLDTEAADDLHTEEDAVEPVEPVESVEPVEIPWLTGPEVALGTVGAIVEAIGYDAQKIGDSDVVHLQVADEVSELGEATSGNESQVELTAVDEAPAEENSDEISDETSEDAAPEGAFVTETMGELLASQGFYEKAVGVYETLAAQKPYDPVLAARLAELRVAAGQAEEAPAPDLSVEMEAPRLLTARERFAALAARRVARRSPPTPRYETAVAAPAESHHEGGAQYGTEAYSVVSPVINEFDQMDSGLASLFGTSANPADDGAARVLAEAFSPSVTEAASAADGFVGSFFSELTNSASHSSGFDAVEHGSSFGSAISTVTEPAASSGLNTHSPADDESSDHISFDRFFPDAALQAPAAGERQINSQPPVAPASRDTTGDATTGTADDLAQFSAWLKGLGNT